MTEQCVECNNEFDKEDMIYVCNKCESGFHEDCREKHFKEEHSDELYSDADAECPSCNVTAAEFYSCNECDVTVCENCEDDHIGEHSDDLFEELEYSEYIAKKL